MSITQREPMLSGAPRPIPADFYPVKGTSLLMPSARLAMNFEDWLRWHRVGLWIEPDDWPLFEYQTDDWCCEHSEIEKAIEGYALETYGGLLMWSPVFRIVRQCNREECYIPF